MLGLHTFFESVCRRTTPSSRRLLLAAFAVVSFFPLALWFDASIARFCLAGRVPGDLQRVLQWSEIVAHGLGVALIALVIYVLDEGRRRALPRLLVSTYAAGLGADVGKLLLSRTRPRLFPLDANILDSFCGWCPLFFPVDGRRWSDSDWMSFPSGHSAVAIAFAIGLAQLYPKGKYLFLAFATLSVLQRITSGAHFLSDTIAGAAIGALVAFAVHNSPRWNRLFCRIERPTA